MDANPDSTAVLEELWTNELYRIRQGEFSQGIVDRIIRVLDHIETPPGDAIEKGLVANLWYMPQFIDWQKDRVMAKGTDLLTFSNFRNAVEDRVVKILGQPGAVL